MKRLLGTVAIAISVLISVPSLEPTAKADESGKKEVGSRRARELIDDLGSKAVRVVYPKPDDTDPYLVVPKTFNWETHGKVKTTIDDLLKLGVAAFPDLAAHVKDDRFCGFTVIAVERPENVGAICDQILKCQIDVCRYSVESKDDLGSTYDLEYQVLSRSKARNWGEWWQKNKDKSLLEMQIVVAKSSLSILKSKKKGHRFGKWGWRQVKEIEQLIQELRTDKKPKPGDFPLDICLIKRSRVTKSGDEERYGFYNGK